MATSAWAQELDLRQLQALPEDSGHRDYYQLAADERGPYVHADYRPGLEAMKRGFQVPASERHGHHQLSWRWRALTLPRGGDECAEGKGDSAGSVYVGWRRGLRWYGLKYSWSAVGKKGAVCDRRNNPFIAGATIILESGGPLNTWVEESIDLDAEFRKYFEGGDARASIPELIGVAILTDGDQTQSPSSADFGGFLLQRQP
jgi:DUF3047 family protein